MVLRVHGRSVRRGLLTMQNITESQRERLLDYFFNSDIAFLVEYIMENTYDSLLEDLAKDLAADTEFED